MLNAQRELVAAFDVQPTVTVTQSETKTESTPISRPETRLNTNTTLIGVGGGAIVGKMLFGGWGAVFGAVAGTAVALYLSQRPQPQPAQPATTKLIETAPAQPTIVINDTPVDTGALLSVIAQICDSLDNLVATFRAQIQRVVNKYESQEKPTIERNFRTLLEGIQSLIGYKRGHNPQEEKYLDKLQTRVEDLAELLDNYDLEAVDYAPEHSDWFEAVESKNASEIKMVSPAIIKGDNLILKGKIFVPLQN